MGKPVLARRSGLQHAGVVPNKHTHLRQGFGGSSARWRNPPKHSRSIAVTIDAKVTHSSTAKAVPARRSASIKRHKQAGVTARRRGLLRRRMKPRKELPMIQELPRSGNTPACGGRDATTLFRPREGIVPGIQHGVTEIIESDKADFSAL